MKICLDKNLYINDYSVFASPKLEIIYKQTVEHPYQQEQRNELLVSTTWMNLKKIRLTKKKKSQSKKVTFCMITCMQHSQNDKL